VLFLIFCVCVAVVIKTFHNSNQRERGGEGGVSRVDNWDLN
jgi:hypothetical protein